MNSLVDVTGKTESKVSPLLIQTANGKNGEFVSHVYASVYVCFVSCLPQKRRALNLN